MATLYYVQNDTAPAINITVKRKGSSSPVDLTGATTKFKISSDDADARTNDAHNTCSAVSLVNGQVKYTPQSGDFANTGSHTCDIEVTWGDGSVETEFNATKIIVREEV